MKLWLLAVGHKQPDWVNQGFAEYAKRLPRECELRLVEIKPEKRVGGKTTEQIWAAERERIEAALPPGCLRVVLDERGAAWTTRQLADGLGGWMGAGCDVALVVGGADGLHPALKASARQLLALSALTLPHGMVRVLLAEQLYRAWSLLNHHPYHRE